MKVLVVTLFAIETNTSVSVSNYEMINALINMGHEVTVLMPTINKNLFYFDDTYKLKNAKIIRIKNQNIASKIVEASTNSSKLKRELIGVIRNAYNKFQILDKTKLLLKQAENIKLEKFYDIVISTSDPKTSHVFLKKLIDSLSSSSMG